jgi:hypothetical protein
MRPAPNSAESDSRAVPTIALAIVQWWLVLGATAVLCMPSLRGTNAWLGWLPLWFVGMPAVEWLLLRWRGVASRSHGVIRQWRQRTQFRRHPTRSRRVRKPVARASRVRTPELMTALLLR